MRITHNFARRVIVAGLSLSLACGPMTQIAAFAAPAGTDSAGTGTASVAASASSHESNRLLASNAVPDTAEENSAAATVAAAGTPTTQVEATTSENGTADAAASAAANDAATAATSFSDVASDAWYADAVAFCAAHNLMTGYDDSTRFGVGDPLTTEQLATILWRIAEPEASHVRANAYAENTTGKTDVTSNQWYTGSMDWAFENGIITGYDGTTLMGVGEPLSAERFVTIVARYCSQGAYLTTDGSRVAALFTDGASIDAWARGSVVWARESGLLTGYDHHDGTYSFAPAENIARERAATIIARACEAGIIHLSDTTDPDTPASQTYTIAFADTRGTGTMPSVTAPINETITLPACTFAHTGYRFLGWATSRTGSAVYADAGMVRNLAAANGTVTLYAMWTPITYTVVIDPNGGTGGSTVIATYGTAVEITNPPTRTGYRLVGYCTTSDGTTGTRYTPNQIVDLSSTEGDTVTLYAQWRQNGIYLVRFFAARTGGTPVSEVETATDGNVTLATATRDGYTLVGWTLGSTGNVIYPAGETIQVDSDVDAFAVWRQNTEASHSATLRVHDGNDTTSYVVQNVNEPYTLQATPATRTGYTFTGWATSEGGSVVYAAGADITGLAAGSTTDLYPVYAPITYTVAINANGGAGDSTIDATYDQDVVVEAAPTRVGYTLTGYNTAADGTGTSYAPDGLLNLTSENGATVTLYAQWERDEVQGTFHTNDDGTGTTISLLTNDEGQVTTPTTLREGSTLVGWRVGSPSSSVVVDVGQPYQLDLNTNFYAVWEKD